MVKKMDLKHTAFASILLFSFFATNVAFAAGKITAEKNCNVRVEGEEFEVGERVLVFRESAGKKKRLAIVEIAKIVSSEKSLGRVVKGPSICAPLKGASVEAMVVKGGGPAGVALGIRADAQAGALLSFVGYPSLAYPGKELATSVSRLRAVGMTAKGDVFPLAFVGKSFLERMVGLGFDVAYSTVFPASEITGPDGLNAGKLSTTLLDLRVDVILRAVYLKDKASTELRFVPFMSRNVTQSYAGEDTGESPLANFNATGMGIGLAQHMLLGNGMRLNVAGLYGLGLKASTEDAAGGEGTVMLDTASGYSADVGLDYMLSSVKLWGAFRIENFAGNGTDTNGGKYTLAADKFWISAGLGFAL